MPLNFPSCTQCPGGCPGCSSLGCKHKATYSANERHHFLSAGDLLFSNSPCEVTTVLGSCVAVTFFSPKRRLAAICHAMLPTPGNRESIQAGDPRRWRYVDQVIPAMCEYFREHGLEPAAINVKLFGGGCLLCREDDQRPAMTIGSANVAMALEILAENGHSVRASDVEGFSGRKLIFDTQTGDVRLKYIGARAKAA